MSILQLGKWKVTEVPDVMKGNSVHVLTLWCRAVHAWRPGWNKGQLQAQRLPGDSRGAAAAVWTGHWRGCETDPPAGPPNPATPCSRRLKHTERNTWETSLLKQKLSRKERRRHSPVSVHKSMYTWAAMRQYISENCSSVFRAFFPVKETDQHVKTICVNPQISVNKCWSVPFHTSVLQLPYLSVTLAKQIICVSGNTFLQLGAHSFMVSGNITHKQTIIGLLPWWQIVARANLVKGIQCWPWSMKSITMTESEARHKSVWFM